MGQFDFLRSSSRNISTCKNVYRKKWNKFIKSSNPSILDGKLERFINLA